MDWVEGRGKVYLWAVNDIQFCLTAMEDGEKFKQVFNVAIPSDLDHGIRENQSLYVLPVSLRPNRYPRVASVFIFSHQDSFQFGFVKHDSGTIPYLANDMEASEFFNTLIGRVQKRSWTSKHTFAVHEH